MTRLLQDHTLPWQHTNDRQALKGKTVPTGEPIIRLFFLFLFPPPLTAMSWFWHSELKPWFDDCVWSVRCVALRYEAQEHYCSKWTSNSAIALLFCSYNSFSNNYFIYSLSSSLSSVSNHNKLVWRAFLFLMKLTCCVGCSHTNFTSFSQLCQLCPEERWQSP